MKDDCGYLTWNVSGRIRLSGAEMKSHSLTQEKKTQVVYKIVSNITTPTPVTPEEKNASQLEGFKNRIKVYKNCVTAVSYETKFLVCQNLKVMLT